jgi:predicted NUDIX family NTP pyrophosphohydrolase
LQKLSAGILVFNLTPNDKLMILLVHPGGPFWRNKDVGAWSIPKGEYGEGEDALSAAKREFKEETGNELAEGEFIPLEPVKIKSGKIISAWAIKAEIDFTFIKSNEFEMEWPPRSGKRQIFPEVDKVEWFSIQDAKIKINTGQVAILDQLVSILKDSSPGPS